MSTRSNTIRDHAQRNGPRVLIVEDNPDLASILAMAINDELGWEVSSASSAEEGWRLIRRHRFSVLLTDEHLSHGGMAGLALASQVKHRSPTLPVLMLSGDPPEGASAVCDRVFRKPYSLAELLTTLRALPLARKLLGASAGSRRRPRRSPGSPDREQPGTP